MGLPMMTSTNVQMPSTNKTMSTHRWKDWKESYKKTWICSHKTWQLASPTVDTKTSRTTSCDTILSPPWTQQKKWIPWSLMNGHRCNVLVQESKDERGLI
jgi:hypothetical protein